MAAPLWLSLVILWIAGIDLRVTILAVPPVLPFIHQDLRFSEAGVGALTGLPILVLSAAAIPGSFLIARLGARRALVVGLLVTAVASGVRGAGPSIAVLFAMTFLMGVGIAITQPAIPVLVHEWCPAHVGLATAVYVNGILIGETLGASLTLPLVFPLTGARWGLSLAVWGALALLSVIAIARYAPALPEAAGSPHTLWWPDWGSAEPWQLGMLLGGTGAAYFGSNAFIPDFLRATGRSELIGACLTALNASQLPASLLAGLGAPWIVGRRAPLVAAGAAIAGALAVFLLHRDWAPVLGAGMLGFCCAFALVLTLALPPILAGRGDVHRLSAGMLALGYAYSFVVPLLGGVAWDVSRVPATSFLPVAAGAVTVLLTASSLRLRRRGWATPPP